MSDNTAPADGNEYNATLVNGNTYTFGGKKYEKGVAKPVDEATMERLKERAVDSRTVEGEIAEDGGPVTELRQKFTFAKIGETVEPVARVRHRAAR